MGQSSQFWETVGTIAIASIQQYQPPIIMGINLHGNCDKN